MINILIFKRYCYPGDAIFMAVRRYLRDKYRNKKTAKRFLAKAAAAVRHEPDSFRSDKHLEMLNKAIKC